MGEKEKPRTDLCNEIYAFVFTQKKWISTSQLTVHHNTIRIIVILRSKLDYKNYTYLGTMLLLYFFVWTETNTYRRKWIVSWLRIVFILLSTRHNEILTTSTLVFIISDQRRSTGCLHLKWNLFSVFLQPQRYIKETENDKILEYILQGLKMKVPLTLWIRYGYKSD